MNEAKQILQEDHRSVDEMANLLGCSSTKIRNLIVRGSTAIDGRVVKLGVAFTESGRRTSLEAYRRFQIDLNTRRDENAGIGTAEEDREGTT